MVLTRNTLQDQEHQRRTLSSLRLNYCLSHHWRKMDPLTPYSQKIDLRTENGRKIYESCTKALSVTFDAVAGKHHVFLTALKNAADERCWREICHVPIGTPPTTFDILTQPGKISFKDLRAHCEAIWAGTTSDQLQQQIRINMMGVCLLNSVSATVSQRLDKDKEKWFFKNRGGKDGLLIFKLLMQYGLQTTRYGSETTKEKLHNLNVKNFGNNVEEMLLHRKTLLDDLQAQGEIFHEDLFWAFKCLETVQEPNAFVRYIEDQKNKWEDGADLTADELCRSAETKFKLLSEAGKWKLTNSKDPIKSKEDEKFLALAAAVKELAKNTSRTAKQTKTGDNPKLKWKFEPPAAGASIEKVVDGKTFWWCDGSGGKHHKAMYCRHKPTDCKEQENKEKDQKPAPASSTDTNNQTGSAPKLKLNNNLVTALAALDKVLQTSTDSDDDAEKDFV
jgi:hypothetical protein